MTAENSRILAIIGQGYVGLPLAMAAVDAGWSVIGVDTLTAKVEQIRSGSSPVEDVSDKKLKNAISRGFYQVTTDFSLITQATVVTICVPTPLNEMREPDLTPLRSAATNIAPHVSNETLIISESTSYPGTLRDVIVPIFNLSKSPATTKLYFASAPERVNPGDSIWNQRNTPRLVGAIDLESQNKALIFYRSICDAVIAVSTPEIAEAAKLFENTFRLVNIALVNEFAQVCSNFGINVNEVIDAASSKPYGFMPFRPGVGVGGHCIPVDPLYLTWWAKQKGISAELVEFADSINQSMSHYIAQRALNLVNSNVKNPRVLILGVAYKAGVRDVRETPATELWNHLISLGAYVAWHDPLVATWQETQSVGIEWECDVVILATNQPGMDISQLIKTGTQILDCTNSVTKHPNVTAL